VAQEERAFDVVHRSGVLYHRREPLHTLRRITAKTLPGEFPPSECSPRAMTVARAGEHSGAGRICFVTTDFVQVVRNGGIGTHCWLMSTLLVERGWEVHVLFCGGVDDPHAMQGMPDRMAAEGITFTWLDDEAEPAWWQIPTYGEGGTHNLRLSQRAFEALERLHARHCFDLIEFADWGALGFRAAQAKRSAAGLCDVRLAVKLHSTTDWQRRGNLALRQSPWDLTMDYCEQYAFEHADLQLSPTQYMVADTRAAGWDVRDDVIVAYPFPEPAGEPGQSLRDVEEIVFFGRLERRKGLDIFLDALDQLCTDLPIVFYGRDTTIDGQAAATLIMDRLGDRPHRIETNLDRDAVLAELRSGGRLAVVASISETFGFTVAECVANQIPFIAARAGGIPEVVRHPEARAHWLFEPTVEGLVAALERRLAADPQEELALRVAAAEACCPRRWNDEVEALYRAALRRPASDLRPAVDAGPTITVVVAYFNHADYLPGALASLASQTVAPDEVWVVDDGSTDPRARDVFDAQELLYPDWQFVREENRGPAVVRNVCLQRAAGKYFVPFDSDNIATPDMIETLLRAMECDGQRAAATCQTLAFTEDDDIAAEHFVFRYAPTGGPRVLAPLENVFGDTCAMFRAESLRSVGGFETLRSSPHEDWETFAKMAFAGLCVDVVPRVLFYYRTAVGGRLETLTAQPGQSYRLRRRMIDDILGDVELTRCERIQLWEQLLAGSVPRSDLAALKAAHEELAAWAYGALAGAEAWRESQLRELRRFLENSLQEAEAWRESQLAEQRGFFEARLEAADALRASQLEDLRTFLGGQVLAATTRAEEAQAGTPGGLSMTRLWRLTLSRTLQGGERRIRARWRAR
jgi:glycosyltransferase involved in cell wall biosynthesis